MKIVLSLLTVLLVSLTGQLFANNLPITRDAFKDIVGNGGTNFKWNDISVKVGRGEIYIQWIDYQRDDTFNELEIESILKPLSQEEDWVQVDDHDWQLKQAKCWAHWDGHGHLAVTSNETAQQRGL